MVTETVVGDDTGGDTPVPIPNTAVKSSRADGTRGYALGRVGSCQLHVNNGFYQAHKIQETRAATLVSMLKRLFLDNNFIKIRLTLHHNASQTLIKPPKSSFALKI